MSDAAQTAAPVAPQPAATAAPTVAVSIDDLRRLLNQGEAQAVSVGDKVAAVGKSMWQNICDFVRPVNAGWLRIVLMVALSALVMVVGYKLFGSATADSGARHPEALLMVMRFALAAGAVAALLLLRRLKMPLIDLQGLLKQAAEQGQAGLAAVAVAIVTLALAVIIAGVLR